MDEEITRDSIETMIDDLKCDFENLFDNDPNDEEYAKVVESLLKLRHVADELLF